MPICSGKYESKVRLEGKTALVTGCNTGIGKETVLDFYKRGARVLMACRTMERAEEAKMSIEKTCEKMSGVGKLVVIKLDLSSLKSVRECAQLVLDTEPQLNILVNNAGVICPYGVTEDNFETQFGTNHLGHFLLTLLLLPRMRSSAPARIVTVSSALHERGDIHFDDLNCTTRKYSGMDAYSQSKLANVLFSRELANKLKTYKMPICSGKYESKVRLEGKTALVTGCNTGIGKETVLDFYKRGARVLMACRTMERAEEAKMSIEKTCEKMSGVGKLVVIKLDLSSLKSVRECAQLVLDTEPQLNILVNNAGVICPYGVTEDNFETQFGTNHLGHFLLTLLLLPRMRSSAPARIVTVSSALHERGDIHFDDLNCTTRKYSGMDAYSQSKLANVLFSRELANKLKLSPFHRDNSYWTKQWSTEHEISGINTYSLHPGVVKTEVNRHANETLFPGSRFLLSILGGLFFKTPQDGAQTQIYCAVDEKCADETGLYYSDCVVKKPCSKALNDEYATKLWNVSLQLVGLQNYNAFTASDPGVKIAGVKL